MSNISIKKDYLNKVKLLNKYNRFYYDKSNPLISDQKYDKLKEDIFIIEKKSFRQRRFTKCSKIR